MFQGPPPAFCAAPGSPLGPGSGALPSWIAPPSKRQATPPVVAIKEPAGPPKHEAPPEPEPEAQPADAHVEAAPPPSKQADDARHRESAAEIEALRAEVAQLRAQLAGALDEAARARQAALFATERDLVRLAIAIAEQVLGREVRTSPAIVARWALEGLAALDEADEATVAIAPDLAELVPASSWEREPVVDPSLAPGKCEVRTRFGKVDASLAARLAAVAEGLLDE